MNTVRIIVKDWTRFPGGRFKSDGEHSGEEFREVFLERNVKDGGRFEIDFNGIFTAGWSFLDEALGHYVSELGESGFRERFVLIADDDPDILEEMESIIAKRKIH
jgi:hypothetical protein